MHEIIWATPLYEFLRQCNASPLEKTVLDCGAGGDAPPLSLFHQYGYTTYGVEIAEEALAQAQEFCQARALPLNIARGDMRALPFGNESFGFVYSFNAIIFMTKPDIARAMSEIERVLKRDGLCFVNFESVDDPDNEPFCETAPLRRLLQSERFAKHADNEADAYFRNFDVLRKEKKFAEWVRWGRQFKRVTIEYIAKKK
ncbi:MAG: class I SAM-dependent methyltransferase [Chloroflexi bacterium]|nr:class I SAM-dependent methyltransferase [Chloroflexota bacterium]